MAIRPEDFDAPDREMSESNSPKEGFINEKGEFVRRTVNQDNSDAAQVKMDSKNGNSKELPDHLL